MDLVNMTQGLSSGVGLQSKKATCFKRRRPGIAARANPANKGPVSLTQNLALYFGIAITGCGFSRVR